MRPASVQTSLHQCSLVPVSFPRSCFRVLEIGLSFDRISSYTRKPKMISTFPTDLTASHTKLNRIALKWPSCVYPEQHGSGRFVEGGVFVNTRKLKIVLTWSYLKDVLVNCTKRGIEILWLSPFILPPYCFGILLQAHLTMLCLPKP